MTANNFFTLTFPLRCSARWRGLSTVLLIGFLVLIAMPSQGQVSRDSVRADSVGADTVKRGTSAPIEYANQYDIGDLYQSIFHPHKKVDKTKEKSGTTIVPNVAANPTIGAQIGIKAVVGKKLGTDTTTFMSVAATAASITTKGIIYFYINHNIFTPGNRWNLQGSLVAARIVTPDFGLGIGRHDGEASEADKVLANADRKGYILHSLYYNFREKVYKNIRPNLFLGAGLSFDIRKNVEVRPSDIDLVPYKIYSDRHGFDRDGYAANGLLFNIQYTTRDNQNRAYKGIYADAGLRANQTWLGSSKSAYIVSTDFRKYWSLSVNRPEHVIAFWNWNAFVVGGDVPYLELPGTGKDGSSRSGRGYTIGYFIAKQFNCSEAEYRFPITQNKFLSGVVFFNIQTANDELGTRLFQDWQPGGGAGLRVLFNKATRTNLCLDYAWGKYGSGGFFLGLNETF
jgi:hypothetical protein